MELKGKTIVIISQQDWGEMFISKNHYALELAKMGNKVFYLPGPTRQNDLKKGAVKISDLKEHKDLHYVEHRFSFPEVLKFKARWLYDYLTRLHVNKILQKTGRVDVVVSFDLSNTIPLKSFPSELLKIYMPVDELTEQAAVNGAQTADIIFSITHEILDKFHSINKPKVFLNHGVSEKFINQNIGIGHNNPIHVGLSGNLLRPDIDKDTLLQIIRDNPAVIFNFWGSTGKTHSNVTPNGVSEEGDEFVKILEASQNVRLHGALPPTQLAEAIKEVDCFLICYDIEKDQSKGTNYHKILEYLATGKVVVSNNVTTYNNYPGMLEMPANRTSNNELPGLMKQVLNNLDTYNSPYRQQERVAFAKQFTYANQLEKIASELTARSL